MSSLKKTARIAGLVYLAWFVVFIAADNGSRPGGSKDSPAVVDHILDSETLFRIHFLADVVAAVLFLLSAWALYVLLKPVNKDYALLFVLLNLGGVAVQCIALLGEFAVLLILNDADYLKTVQPDQLKALAALCLDLYRNGFMLAQIFWGLWLFPLGYLVFRSGFLPRSLGILLVLDGVGILIWFFQFFLFPGAEAVTYPGLMISFVAELSLALWLLIKGVKDQESVLAGAG